MLSFGRSVLLAMLPALVTAAPVLAQPPERGGRGEADRERVAYGNGYQTGYDNGARDKRSGQLEEFGNDRDYREADRGYDPRGGDRDAYRENFRRGYAAGYVEGYRGMERRARGRELSRDAGQGRGDRPRGSSGLPPLARIAYEAGYRDGYDKGREDLRDQREFDPTRHAWYRDGDRGYDLRYGDRGQYRAQYRAGFAEGYGDGFRRHDGM